MSGIRRNAKKCSSAAETRSPSVSCVSMRIEGKRVLLTGATGGLGRAIAEGLAARGATLVLSSRKREELDALAAELPGDGHAVAVSDLAEEGAAERLASEAGD